MGFFNDLRGVVEGFYGPPYPSPHRLAMLDIVSGLPGVPAWLHAPKDDPFHRMRWRERRPDASMTDLESSVSGAKRLGVSWIEGCSPWRFREGDAPLVREKAAEARGIGAAGFAVLFDDVEEPATRDLAAGQAALLAEAAAGSGLPVVACPTVYCGEQLEEGEGEAYLDEFIRLLPEGCAILWTGSGVIPRRMDLCPAVEGIAAEGRVVIWDNLLADDYTLRRLFLGEPRDRVVEGCGYLLNPSFRALPSIYTLWRMASLLSGGGAPEIPPVLAGLTEGLALLSEFHDIPWGVRPKIIDLLDSLGDALERGTGFSAAAERACRDLESFRDRLKESPGGFEILPYLNDITRLLSIWRKALASPHPGRELERLMVDRLPWDHPLAIGTARRMKS